MTAKDLRRLLRSRGVADASRVHDDGGTGGGHRFRGAVSDALGRTGDERNFASQGPGQRVL